MPIQIRKFTEQGIKEFEALLENFRIAKEIDEGELYKLVFNDTYTLVFDEAEPLTLEADNNKYNIAKNISQSLNLDQRRELDKDKGLWTWLSALILNRLIKRNIKTGEIKISYDNSLYVYDPAHNRYYRHLIAFPCLIYSSLREIGKKIFLRDTIDERGEIVEQLSAVQDIQRNRGVVEAATILYYDPIKDDVIRGAASKENEKKNLGGQARRFRVLLKQLALTYDLNAMNGNQIVELLPKEFERWKKRHNSPETISAI
jgi:hypothetical protein